MLGIKEGKVVNVALGKAHGVALTDKGIVYTFGINNKGQCGRDGTSFSNTTKSSGTANSSAKPVFSIDPVDDEVESEDSCTAADSKLCPQGEHRWSIEQCMICIQCHQCTGFGSSCVNTDTPGRVPGT